MKISAGYEARRVASSAESEHRQRPSGTISILVVDDDHDSADGLAMLLELWGHRVRVAYDPKEAMAIFREQRPDLAILDIGLPGMDGYQLAVLLRAQEHQAVLVALTAYTDRRRALSAGFTEHFPKPLDADALRGLIANMPPPGMRGIRPIWP